ncbi:MAG: argininosuccinate lyase, partial [Actinomycetales bacterium]|nr:argininosuccinate lyase [Actinomycetales bacterium]
LPFDIAQSRAHVAELARCGYLEPAQAAELDAALAQIAQDFREGAWSPSADDEDVHSAVERTLLERCGADLGGRVRTGRSRNDQVATDFRLYLLDAAARIARETTALGQALAAKAEQHHADICSGFTHLQHAQPVTFGHELGKHVWALLRDLDRLRDWYERANVSPMGAGALAGTSLGLDPQRIAVDLGFAAVAQNSIDAVSDRDFVAEFCFVTAMLGVHLSRLGEEVCIWASPEFGWVRLHDSWSTGSSLMPQKRNPDIAELARGKSGRLIGSLVTVMTMLKGLPFGYNRDQQEDKEAAFDAVATLLLTLPAMAGLIASLDVDVDRLAQSVRHGHSTATDVAEWLVRAGLAFREAHEVAGACVRAAEARGCDVSELTDADLAAVHPLLDGAAAALTPESSLAARTSVSGPAPQSVAAQLQRARAMLDEAAARW